MRCWLRGRALMDSASAEASRDPLGAPLPASRESSAKGSPSFSTFWRLAGPLCLAPRVVSSRTVALVIIPPPCTDSDGAQS